MSFVNLTRPLSRRTVLKGMGVALALPFLDAMSAPAWSAEPATMGGAPRRMLCIETNQGILPQHFFPSEAGRAYTLTPYLEILKDYRERMTVFSGVSLPEVDGGHHCELCFLTGAGHPGRGGFRNTISLDQFAAERVGLLGLQARLPLHHHVDLVDRYLGVVDPGRRLRHLVVRLAAAAEDKRHTQACEGERPAASRSISP